MKRPPLPMIKMRKKKVRGAGLRQSACASKRQTTDAFAAPPHSSPRSKSPRLAFGRVIMIEVFCFDWKWPDQICFRPIPFYAPKHFTTTIHATQRESV